METAGVLTSECTREEPPARHHLSLAHGAPGCARVARRGLGSASPEVTRIGQYDVGLRRETPRYLCHQQDHGVGLEKSEPLAPESRGIGGPSESPTIGLS